MATNRKSTLNKRFATGLRILHVKDFAYQY